MRIYNDKRFGLLLGLLTSFLVIFFVFFTIWVIRAYAINVSGDISSNTIWAPEDGEYILTGNVTVKSGATLTINPSTVIKSSGNYAIIVQNGGALVADGGSPSTPITFQHSTATTANNWGGIVVQSGGTALIKFATIKHANIGIRVDGGTLNILNSTLETNNTGIDVYGQASITTTANTFDNNTYFPIAINPDVVTVSLGSGADADILGTNGYDAIALGYQNTINTNISSCNGDVCTIPQRDFAGVSGIPYVVWNAMTFSTDEYNISAGVIMKFNSGKSISVNNSAVLNVNGVSGNEVIFTSYKDDSIVGDTNNDGTATVPEVNNWGGIYFDTSSSIINYAQIYYSNRALEGKNVTLTVNDSDIEYANFGIALYDISTLTTNRNYFDNIAGTPLSLFPSVVTTFGSGIDADNLGTIIGAYGIAFTPYWPTQASTCPGDVCTIGQETFAGITNIPYILWDDTYWKTDTYNIDAGVIIKVRGGKALILNSGAALNINGLSGSEVVFTSLYDDTYGGDTNNDSTATTPATGNWDNIYLDGTTATIDYTQIYYSNRAIEGKNTTLTVNDSDIEYANFGIVLYDISTLTTNRNYFDNITGTPLSLFPSVSTVFGAGVDADGLGTAIGADGIAFTPTWSVQASTCPSDICTINQKTFAGIVNIPYVLWDDTYWKTDTYNIDPGVIIKSNAGKQLIVNSGGILKVNGISGNEVVFTSIKDDTAGGDTNNDSTATTPAAADWDGIYVDGTMSTVDYAQIYYGNRAIDGANATLAVNDSDIGYANHAIAIKLTGTLVTNRNTFHDISVTPVAIHPGVTYTPGSGVDTDVQGSNITYDAIAFYPDNTNTCPAGVCTVESLDFAGITNIPYLVYSSKEWLDDIYNVDPGVIIKFGAGVNLKMRSNGSLSLNGESGNEVLLTSIKDDTGGDTNNDGSSTTPAADDWNAILMDNAGNIDISNSIIRYGTRGFYGSAASLDSSDSLYDTLDFGIGLTGVATFSTQRNTFQNIGVTAVAMNPGVTYTPGSGADVDILGINVAYDAIAFYPDNNNQCPLNICTLSSLNFAGIENTPYFAYSSRDWLDKTYNIDPGVIVKFNDNVSLKFRSSAKLNVYGTITNPVYFTSIHDDNVGGDANNNGNWTIPDIADWNGIIFESGPNEINFAEFRAANKALNPKYSALLSLNDSKFLATTYAIYLESSVSPVLNRNNFLQLSTVYNNSSTYFNAENQYWGSSTGPKDYSDDGACTSNIGGGGVVVDDASRSVDYCPFATTQYNVLYTPSISLVSGAADIYAGKYREIVVDYSDGNGASDLNNLYLSITNPSADDITYTAVTGDDGTDLVPANVTGSAYAPSVTYDRDNEYGDANTVRITWKFSYIDWDWTESSDIEFAAQGYDTGGLTSGWVSTDGNYIYENDLEFTGTLSVDGEYQGALSTGSWVRASENVTWGGVKVVYQGTTDVYPSDDDFDVTLTDDDTGSWPDTTSSGSNISIVSTADSVTDTEDIHTLSITGIPTGGSAVSSIPFTIRVDDATPDIVAITGDNDDVWQSNDSGPVISWTDPVSPSDDTFYITNDGSEPTATNYQYTTASPSYDLPDQGLGTTIIKVIAMNGVGVYSTSDAFTIKFDNVSPDIVDVTGADEGVWQGADSGPVVSWTDPASLSDDVFYLTNNGSDPTSSNYAYTTASASYDLPDQGEGETTIKVRAVSGSGLLGPIYNFIIRYDAGIPDIVAVTGDNNNTWQSIEGGPVISWTDPSSASDDTFYITIDSSVPTSSNYEYMTTNASYDLPDQGPGETIINVRPLNGLGVYGAVRSFVVKYDPSVPSIAGVTGPANNVWQNTDSSPTITWTDPASVSNDTFYITIDGTEPTSSNYEYMTTNASYSLPDLGQGEKLITVRALNGAGTYSTSYSYIHKYDSVINNISGFSIEVLSTTGLKLTWINPTDSDFSKVKIVRKTGGIPTSVSDGTLVYEGGLSLYSDMGLSEGTKYYYSIFAIDELGNIASGASNNGTTSTSPTDQENDANTGTDTTTSSVKTNINRYVGDDLQVNNPLIEELEQESSDNEDIVIPDEQPLLTVRYPNMVLDIYEGEPIHFFPGNEVTVTILADRLNDSELNIDSVFMIIGDNSYIMRYDLAIDAYQTSLIIEDHKGDYEGKIMVVYDNGEVKNLSFMYSIDPFGYVYVTNKAGQQRIKGAKVEIWTKQDGRELLWRATDEFKYPNPQYTNPAGEYSFVVEAGEYQIRVYADGFEDYSTEWFEVSTAVVQKNIELDPTTNLQFLYILLVILGLTTLVGGGVYLARQRSVSQI